MGSGVFEADVDGLGAILEALPEFVVVVDLDGVIRYLNHAEAGYDADEFVGIEVERLLPPKSEERFEKALEALVGTGEPQEYDVEVTLSEEVSEWYRTRMSPLGPRRPPSEVLMVATNVTELKKQEMEVERLRSLLPICSWCNRVRSDAGAWLSVEEYLEREDGTRVSHGICPECSREELDAGEGADGSNGNAA